MTLRCDAVMTLSTH